MTYSKKFFVIFTAFSALIATLGSHFLRKWVSPLIGSLWLITALFSIAVAGRISGTLAESFARLFGKAMFLSAFKMLTSLFLRQNIQTTKLIKTPQGLREINYVQFTYCDVLKELEQKGEPLETIWVDRKDFQNYLQVARYDYYYPDYYKGAPKYLVHKQIQHFLSTILTPVKTGSEIWMDVASSTSPFPDIMTRLSGIDVYRQDLTYSQGVHGLYIGSNAISIPMPDASVDRISLHCSFEHFENQSDSLFIYELARILRSGGMAAIVPLYLSNTYQILSHPRYWFSRGVPKENGAQITISHTYWESHGRFYDAHSLYQRVIQPLQAVNLNYEFIQIKIPQEIDYPDFMVLKITKG